MTEITVESIDAENPAPAEAEPAARERGALCSASEPTASAEVPPAQPVLERQVAFQTTSGEVSSEAAPKKRGRPKGAAKPKPRPKAAPTPVEEEPLEPPPPMDVNALLAPLQQAYMLNSHVAQRQAKAQRNRTLAHSMFSRTRQRFNENSM